MSLQNIDLARSVAVERERDLRVSLAQWQADLRRPTPTEGPAHVTVGQRWHEALVHLHLAHRPAR